jgi:predicted protein tyrosine phosphatase
MDILVLSRFAFEGLMIKKDITAENIEKLENAFFISIQNPAGDRHIPYFTENKENLLIQYFADVEKDETHKGELHKAFTEEQAIEMNKFIQRHQDKKVCVVHCTAGVSRSGAVGAFIAEVLGINYLDYTKANPAVQPNAHVLNLLRKTKDNAISGI